MTESSSSEGLFVVDLRGIDLPPGASDRIARAVRQAALSELAGLAPQSPLTVTFSAEDTPKAHDVVGGVHLPWPLGIWFDPSQDPRSEHDQ